MLSPKSKTGVSNILASLGHTGRRVVLGHTLNTQTLTKTDEQNNKKVLNKFTILCWATFIAILGHLQPTGWAMGWTPLVQRDSSCATVSLAQVSRQSNFTFTLKKLYTNMSLTLQNRYFCSVGRPSNFISDVGQYNEDPCILITSQKGEH